MLNILIAEGTPAVWQAERRGFGLPSNFSLLAAAVRLHDPGIRCMPLNITDGEALPFGTRQTRQNGEMPRIAPILARAVFDIGVVVDRVLKSRLYGKNDFGNARRKVASLRRTARLHQDRLPLRGAPHLQWPGAGVVRAGIGPGMDAG